MIYIHLRFITCILLVIHKNKTPKPPTSMNMKMSKAFSLQ